MIQFKFGANVDSVDGDMFHGYLNKVDNNGKPTVTITLGLLSMEQCGRWRKIVDAMNDTMQGIPAPKLYTEAQVQRHLAVERSRWESRPGHGDMGG